MRDFSILIGGKAGFGIDSSGTLLAHLCSSLGYHVYVYRDYPSVIRGGHTFSIIRASTQKMSAHKNSVDFLLALDQPTFDLHKEMLKDSSHVIFDASTVKAEGIGIPVASIIKEEGASELMRNSCVIGAFGKAIGVDWKYIEGIFQKHVRKDMEHNLKVAFRGYQAGKEQLKIERISSDQWPILTGDKAISLGLLQGGLEAYIAYPMTPSSGTLHFLASIAEEFNIEVIHPESEISVIIMALGFSYSGKKVALGTSGGGFCLMTEGVSFSGMAELPVVVVLGQRPGPATGLPTYTSQGDLNFILHAGHGEFVRLVVAPGDAEEAYSLSCLALNLAWKYQIPAFILVDKHLCEGTFSFNSQMISSIQEMALSPSQKPGYKRYEETPSGVSPLAFPPLKGSVIKINSYEHDEAGITIEEAQSSRKMIEKRLRKEGGLLEEIEKLSSVGVSGNKDSSCAILCWGSNKGVCKEVAFRLNLKMIHPQILSPFPVRSFQKIMKEVKRVICVESNASGQLAHLVESYGCKIDSRILKYDGRPFTVEELEEEVKKVMI